MARRSETTFFARLASDRLFHIASATSIIGFAGSVSKTPLQRFHSIIIGSDFGATFATE
jgi:hypothetical protein